MLVLHLGRRRPYQAEGENVLFIHFSCRLAWKSTRWNTLILWSTLMSSQGNALRDARPVLQRKRWILMIWPTVMIGRRIMFLSEVISTERKKSSVFPSNYSQSCFYFCSKHHPKTKTEHSGLLEEGRKDLPHHRSVQWRDWKKIDWDVVWIVRQRKSASGAEDNWTKEVWREYFVYRAKGESKAGKEGLVGQQAQRRRMDQ